jgi:hypothetical protein
MRNDTAKRQPAAHECSDNVERLATRMFAGNPRSQLRPIGRSSGNGVLKILHYRDCDNAVPRRISINVMLKFSANSILQPLVLWQNLT